MTELNFHQLRIFFLVARLRSFSRAARELEISQPAVSAQVRQFEDDLGLVLVDRARHRVELTEAGRAVASYAERLFSMSEELMDTVGVLRDSQRARLTLGASPTIGEYLLPKFLSRFRKANPSVVLQVEIAPTRVIINRLLTDEIGIGFISDDITAPDIASHPFAVDELILVAVPEHPLAGKQSASAAELSTLEYIMPLAGSSGRRVAESRLTELGVRPQIVLELGTNEAVKQAAMASGGVAVLSRWAVRREIESGQLATIGRETLGCHRKFSYIVRRSRQITDVQRSFLDLVQEADEVKIAS